MTKADFDSKYSPIVMPEPFAGSGDRSMPANTQDDASGFSFPLGFNSDYSSPSSNNGKFVTRAQMNEIGNLATHNDFHRRCGGLNTFDPEFAEAIGGYPKGAVLQYFDGINVINLISNVENNKYNFLVEPYSSDYWIKSGEVIKDYSYTGLKYKSTVDILSYDPLTIGSFRSPKRGTVTISDLAASFDYTQEQTINSENVSLRILGTGVLAIKDQNNINSANYTQSHVLAAIRNSPSWSGGYNKPLSTALECDAGDIITIAIQNGWHPDPGKYTAWPLSISFEIKVI